VRCEYKSTEARTAEEASSPVRVGSNFLYGPPPAVRWSVRRTLLPAAALNIFVETKEPPFQARSRAGHGVFNHLIRVLLIQLVSF
jgi:hypothetical protein